MANIPDIERLNYYEGEFLGAADFQAEQEYHRDMRRRHNIGQHTWGIVSGLDLVQIPNGTNVPGANPSLPEVDIYIQPGMAVDAFGREIVALNKIQLTQDLFSSFVSAANPGGGLNPPSQTMYVWLSYAQLLLQPPTDPCALSNQPNAYGRVQEAFSLTVSKDSLGPANDAIVVDGKTLPLPTPLQPGDIVFSSDNSIPYQEFSTDDSTVNWHILLGQVTWFPTLGVFGKLDDSKARLGRIYCGEVAAAIYAPAAALTIRDRFSSSPLPAGSPGVSATIEGSLTVVNQILAGSWPISTDPGSLSPLTVVAGGDNGDWIQLRSASGQAAWDIFQNLKGKNPGLSFGEIVSAGGSPGTLPGKSRLFIESGTGTKQGGNVGVGTDDPQQNLSVAAGLNLDQLASNDGSSLDPGLSFGSNATEGIASNQKGGGTNPYGLNFYTSGALRLSIQQDGKVGIGVNPTQNLSVNGGLSIDQGKQNNGSNLSPGLSFGANATEGIASNQSGGGTNGSGLDFYTSGASRLCVTKDGKVGIGTASPQQNLSVSGGLNIDQANQNPGGVVSPGLTFGYGSGEGIASNRIGGANLYGLDFYTNFHVRMSINNAGTVNTTGNLTIGSFPVNLLPVPQAGTLAVNGNRSFLLGTDQGNWHWIMAGGAAEFTGGSTGNNALGFSYDSATGQGYILLNSNWNLHVGGNLWVGGSKSGYVVDRFISHKGEQLEQGDVVVLCEHPTPHFYGSEKKIPLITVELTDEAHDTRVCGVVDEPVASAASIRDLDRAKFAAESVGLMVTLGAYAHCKVDADIAPIAVGDLLTTSSSRGYAQKLNLKGSIGPGAIIGKALSSLKKGKGKISILVSHQ